MLSRIKLHAQQFPQQPALVSTNQAGVNSSLSYTALCELVSQLAGQQFASELKLHGQEVVATVIDNSLAWIVLDLSLLEAGLLHIPLPAYFTNVQMQHAISDAGVTVLITDQADRFVDFEATIIAKTTITHSKLTAIRFTPKGLTHTATLQDQPLAKITYTSGTTSQPKGVCLPHGAMLKVAQSVAHSVGVNVQDRHLCILPLATLLENVAGVYASLLAGASVHVLPTQVVGFSGSQFQVERLFNALQNTQASTAILIPELLKALIQWLARTKQTLPQLRFLAVGGAHVASELLKKANALGLPVYEGYGLSESASVICLNTPQANKVGSVGRPLPHVTMRLASDDEIWVKGANFSTYTSQKAVQDDEGFMPTGDLGYYDKEGYWYIRGRKKHMFISSFGRNISPEWVESELTHLSSIAQACLFGEAQPINVALLLARPEASAQQVSEDIERLNTQLPDYARVSRWWLLDNPFSPDNNQLTANGRLKRDVIAQVYQTQIQTLFNKEST